MRKKKTLRGINDVMNRKSPTGALWQSIYSQLIWLVHSHELASELKGEQGVRATKTVQTSADLRGVRILFQLFLGEIRSLGRS